MNPLALVGRMGLRWQLFLIVVLAVVPVITLMLYDASRDRAHEVWEIERDARESAVDAAWRHEQLVEQGRQMLVLLGQLDAVKGGDAAACSTVLEAVLQASPRYTMLAVADPGGNVTCSALPLLDPLSIGGRAYFQRAYSTRDFAVDTYLIGRVSGKATLPFASPVTDASGAVEAVIFAGLDSAWLAEFARGSELPFGADLSILDHDGAVLAHHPETHAGDGHHDTAERVFRATAGYGGAGTAHAKDERGQDRYYAFAPLRLASGESVAFVGISFSQEEAFVDIERALRRNIGGIVVVALLALGAAWWVSARLITRPTTKLAEAASKLAAGDLGARTGLPYQSGEMGQLAAAFDAMADSLQARQEELQESEGRYRTLAEAAHDAIFIVDMQGRVLFANSFAARQLGSRPQDLVGRAIAEVFPFVEVEEQKADIRRVCESGQASYVERRVRLPAGEVWLGTQLVPLKGESGKVTGVLGIARDITETKRAEEQIRASLAEKEALLNEVHHRVKNNLQVISSLLDLQAGSMEDENALRLFRETQNRVRSMSLVHEQLYRSADLARIEFDDYVRTLTTNLFRTWGVSAEIINLKMNVEHVQVPVDKAIPFGLIINELLSNSFKHAFPGGRRGKVSIDFSLEDGKFSLVVRDNGVGIPPGLDIESSNTLGLQLVNALSRQCRGAMEVHTVGGTEFRFTFPA